MKVPTVLIIGMLAMLGMASDAAAQKVKASVCGSDVGLNVTIAGTRSAPGGFGLVSDGLGTYQSGSRATKVTAIFQVENCTHDFTMNLGQSTRKMWTLLSGGDVGAWFFNLDRIHSVPVTTVATFLTSKFCTTGVVYGADGKVAKNSEGAYQDNYAGCDVDETGAAFVRRAGGFSLEGDDRLSFSKSPIDHPLQSCAVVPGDPACGASFLRVYHPDATTWIIRNEPSAIGSHRVWAGGNDGYVFVGYETVPLEIVVRRQ